jgi:uncharacterized iron-regulated membrane protein
VLSVDPVSSHGVAARVQGGEIRSRGVEFEAKTEINDNLKLLASYTYLDNVWTKSTSAAQVGMRPTGVIYGPFMRRLEFGTVRANRSTRLRWLDLHNLIGVTTLAWALVVGATGVLNEVSRPLFTLWQQTDVKAMLVPLRGKPVPETSELSSPQTAFDTVKAAYPDMVATSVVFPGSPFGTPYHYLIWTKGQTPLTSRLFQPVLVDARNGALGSAVAMPWYLRAVEVSRPLHFGHYGGMPLKIIWIALDLATIFVLGGGLYLWLLRRSWVRAKDARTAGYGAATPTLSPGSAK